MTDILASLGLMILAVYTMGLVIMMWRPFYMAILQGKMVTEVYGFAGIFTEWGKALIWPYIFLKKTG